MESIGLGSLRRVLLSIPLDLRLASTALALGNRVHHGGDMVSAAPPSDLVCQMVSRCHLDLRQSPSNLLQVAQ